MVELGYYSSMIRIKFPDRQNHGTALGWLAGRFSFKSFDDGTMLLPEEALGPLAAQGVRFTAEGKAAYAQIIPTIRTSSPSEVQ